MFKRLFDFVAAVLLLFILSPLLLLLYFLVLFDLGRPVLFSQIRTGKGNKPFRMFKFRTMTNGRDISGQTLSDELRLTKFGSFLRSSSLDELPELYNVLLGDMSIVGPRPLHHYYLPRYSPRQRKRHIVRPGITGYAQVKGRNALSWDEKFDYDVYYVFKKSLAFDFYILLLTFKVVLLSVGVQPINSVSMPEFTGPSTSFEDE